VHKLKHKSVNNPDERYVNCHAQQRLTQQLLYISQEAETTTASSSPLLRQSLPALKHRIGYQTGLQIRTATTSERILADRTNCSNSNNNNSPLNYTCSPTAALVRHSQPCRHQYIHSLIATVGLLGHKHIIRL
jgi:hypothetical protein